MRSAFLLSTYYILIGPMAAPIFAQQVGGPTAVHAVVRQYSHGISATVIWTGPGKSYILGCGHGYPTQRDRSKPITLDIPAPNPTGTKVVAPKLVALYFNDRVNNADLSLIELPDGPLAYVMPVAPEGFQPGRNVRSAGYDGMKMPGVNASATLVQYASFTRERPVPGRSGGALFDGDAGYLIGVCTGYMTQSPGYGIYVNHETIVSFLKKNNYAWLITPGGSPVAPPSIIKPPPPAPRIIYQQPRPQCPT